MKKIQVPLALLAVFTLSACEQQAAPEPATAGPEEAMLDTTEQRISYGIAYGLGRNLKSEGVPLKVPAFSAGLADAFEGRESRLTEAEITAELQAFQQQQMAEKEQAAAVLAEQGREFLSTNASAEGVVVLESGLQYRIIEAGDGAVPAATDTVSVHYRGTLVDGQVFDSSYERGQPATFGVTQVIPGWTEALQLMPVGSKWELFIPSDLAYGPRGTGAGGPIGPNATLIFEVELLNIQGAPAAEAAPAPTEEG